MKKLFIINLLVLALGACTVIEEKKIDKVKASDLNAQLGAAYMQEGLLKAANEKLEKALNLDPKNAQAHNIYGLLNNELKQYEKAEKHLKKALSLKPKDSSILNNYGSFLCERGNIEKAESMFKKALEDPLYQTPEFAWANAGACMLNVPDFAKADDYLRKALRKNPKLPSALFHSAKLHYLKGIYAVSQNYLERYHAVSKKDAKSLWLGLRLAWKLGDKNIANNYAFLLKKQFPDSDETRNLIQAESARSRSHR